MRIHRHQTWAVADITQHVTHRIDFHFIEAHFFHLFFDAVHHALFIAAFAWDSNHIAQKAGHVLLVVVGFFNNQFKRNMLSHEDVLQF